MCNLPNLAGLEFPLKTVAQLLVTLEDLDLVLIKKYFFPQVENRLPPVTVEQMAKEVLTSFREAEDSLPLVTVERIA